MRAIAALLVVSQHILYKGHTYGFSELPNLYIGNYGVDLFFIISGYIICQATHNKNTTVFAFIKNRFVRIIPLYWILTLLALLIYTIKPDLVNSGGGKTDILQSFLLIPTENKFLVQNGWTLSYELFFYIAFSLTLSFNGWMKTLLVSSLFIAIACYTYFSQSAYYFFFNNSLLVEFIFGMLCFNVREKILSLHAFSKALIITAFMISLTYEILNPDSIIFTSGRFIYAGIPMLLCFISLLSLEHEISKHKEVKTIKLIRLIGDASYSLYLSHAFVLSAMAIITSRIFSSPLLFVSSLLISAVVASLLCYWFVEKRMTIALKKLLTAPK